jgi:uncharacterized membrane protein
MLQDLDEVTVNLTYGNGTTRAMKVFLKKDSSQHKVLVQSQQFSQEAELGKTASYDLRLEQFSSSSDPFSLEAVNLPDQIEHYFKDAASDARLTQVRFEENTNSKNVAFVVSLPDRPSDQVAMEKVIEFYVLVIPTAQRTLMTDLASKHWTKDEIEKLGVGYARLELMPRGKGQLIVKAPQLYYSMHADGKAEIDIDLVNEGTQELKNVELKLDPPLNWTKTIEPRLVPSLGVGEEKTVKVIVSPSSGVSVGRYDFRIQSSALTNTEPVNGEDKVVTVEIQSDANIFGTIAIVLLIVGLVGVILVFGIRLAKK